HHHRGDRRRRRRTAAVGGPLERGELDRLCLGDHHPRIRPGGGAGSLGRILAALEPPAIGVGQVSADATWRAASLIWRISGGALQRRRLIVAVPALSFIAIQLKVGLLSTPI